MDTIGTSKLVLFILLRGHICTKVSKGYKKVSLIVRSPLIRGVLYKEFRCGLISTSL